MKFDDILDVMIEAQRREIIDSAKYNIADVNDPDDYNYISLEIDGIDYDLQEYDPGVYLMNQGRSVQVFTDMSIIIEKETDTPRLMLQSAGLYVGYVWGKEVLIKK